MRVSSRSASSARRRSVMSRKLQTRPTSCPSTSWVRGEPLEHPAVGKFQQVEALGGDAGVDVLDPRQERVGDRRTAGRDASTSVAGGPAVHDLARDAATSRTYFWLKSGHAALAVRHQDAVGGGFQRGAHQRQRMGELLRLALQCLLRPDELLLGALAREQDALGVLQGDRAQQLLLVLVCCTIGLRGSVAASAVPSTRARIFANAVSRVVDVSSQNGENPQSSVVPSCSSGMYSAASRMRSRTSSGVSTRGSIGATTPTKTR